MDNILIIKTGAAGDVVRTTSLLNVLDGHVYWVTASKNKPLLPESMPGLTVLSLQDAFQNIKTQQFRQVVSLEEDLDCARLATEINSNHLTGVYSDKNRINYTDDSAHWFDMSRISKQGIIKANELKKVNEYSYQHHIFRMVGKNFTGQPYKIFADASIKTNEKLIGIEKRTGPQWPDKQWYGYDELIKKLSADDLPVKVFQQRESVREYMNDIAECAHIVSGDTLAMHIALAYKKNCTTIFNCTSPQEIYDYGLMKKMVSPVLNKYFYATSFDREAVESIPVEEVYKTIPLFK